MHNQGPAAGDRRRVAESVWCTMRRDERTASFDLLLLRTVG